MDIVTLGAALKGLDGKADASDITGLQAQIDNLITPVTQDAEVQNARVDASGIAHTTLKARIDSTERDLDALGATIDEALKTEIFPEWKRATIDTRTGEEDGNTKRVCTVDFIEVTEGLRIHLEGGAYFGLRFYDTNKDYLGYTNFQNIDGTIAELNTFNADYFKIVARNSTNTTIEHTSDVADLVHLIGNVDISQMNADIESNSDRITALEDQIHTDSKRFYASYEAVEIPQGISDFKTSRLSLVATKKDNYYNAENNPITDPRDVGYLYLDVDNDDFYYSPTKWDNPQFLFSWDRSATPDNSGANKWCPIITAEGDIVFVMQGKETIRKNPIVYPHSDYQHPIVVNLSSEYEYTAAGLTTDTGAVVSCYDKFVLFGEYRENKGGGAYNGEPIRIWKISAPYTNISDWEIKLTKYHSDSEIPWEQDSTNEVAHFHTVSYDHYTGYYYANTGDADTSCRIFVSKDKGETWTEIMLGGGQQWRGLGYVYTADGVYWGTDSANWEYHNLYFAERDINGEIDFSTTSILAHCRHDSGQLQRTYNTCLCHNPDGILLLDRAEPRTDGLLNLEFYSFDDNTLHLVDVLQATEYDATTMRFGFGNFATTYYQNVNADGIICGGMPYDRRMSLDILRNTRENRVGNTKITIHQMW